MKQEIKGTLLGVSIIGILLTVYSSVFVLWLTTYGPSTEVILFRDLDFYIVMYLIGATLWLIIISVLLGLSYELGNQIMEKLE